MPLWGNIIADEGIDRDAWIALIQEHSSLTHPQPRKGINPLTRQPIILRPHDDTALLTCDGSEMGSIYWAMDGSPMLSVQLESRNAIPLVEEMARKLDARFVLEE